MQAATLELGLNGEVVLLRFRVLLSCDNVELLWRALRTPYGHGFLHMRTIRELMLDRWGKLSAGAVKMRVRRLVDAGFLARVGHDLYKVTLTEAEADAVRALRRVCMEEQEGGEEW